MNNSNILTGDLDAETSVTDGVQTASTGSLSFQDGQQLLSGTDLYFGVVESMDLLSLSPEYILRDGKSIFYAYFEQEPNAVKKTVQQLGGNIHMMASESEIAKNQLFGEKVSFINLPEYKNTYVLMLLEVSGKYWFLQIPYEQYHKSKDYLKSLFI